MTYRITKVFIILFSGFFAAADDDDIIAKIQGNRDLNGDFNGEKEVNNRLIKLSDQLY